MTSSSELIAVLEKEPTNFDLYLVIADLLEEEDNPRLSIAYRFCGMNRKYPRIPSHKEGGAYQWTFNWQNRSSYIPEWDHARLPTKPLDENKENPLGFLYSFTEVMQALADNLEFAGILT